MNSREEGEQNERPQKKKRTCEQTKLYNANSFSLSKEHALALG
jgi:hypothetical protein